MAETKICPICGVERLRTSFGTQRRVSGRRAGRVESKAYCQTCSRERGRIKYAEKRDQMLHTSSTALTYMLKRAASRCNSFNRKHGFTELSLDALRSAWEAQDGKCALSGLLLDPKACRTKSNLYRPSLDKIDPSLGYSLGNIRWLCWSVNAAKGCGTDTDLLAIANAIVQNQQHS